MYCLGCKKKTDSVQINQRLTTNNRKLLCAVCKVCGSKKSQFVSSKSGQGMFNDVLSAVGNTVGELHLPARQGEYVPNGSFNDKKKYSYCGPGTKYEQRNLEGYQGINELDRMCKLHDQFYNENSNTALRNISDEALAHRALEIANDPRFDSTQRILAKGVEYIMKNKAKFGLGVESKNLKRGPAKKK